MEQIIPCPQGCAPGTIHLGPDPKTLRWTFVPPGGGAIEEVAGLPDPTFSNGRQSGSDFLMDYNGASGGDLSWPYRVTANPACPKKASQAQLSNGPG